MAASKTVLITGATGFWGRQLCDYFRKKGDTVRGLVRRTNVYPFTEPGVTLFKSNLPDEIDVTAFKGVDIVIHGAYHTARLISIEEAHRVNHDGTMRVYETSKSAGVAQFVFISSTGAHAEAESYYGKSKFALEQLMNPEKDLIIRPGLIIGPGEDGTFNRMKESLCKSGIVPIFDGGHQILQTIHIDDLCKAIDLVVEKRLTGLFIVVEPQGLEVRDFFKLVAARLNKRCILVPLPMSLTLTILRIIEKFHIPFPLSSENLLGLKLARGFFHVIGNRKCQLPPGSNDRMSRSDPDLTCGLFACSCSLSRSACVRTFLTTLSSVMTSWSSGLSSMFRLTAQNFRTICNAVRKGCFNRVEPVWRFQLFGGSPVF